MIIAACGLEIICDRPHPSPKFALRNRQIGEELLGGPLERDLTEPGVVVEIAVPNHEVDEQLTKWRFRSRIVIDIGDLVQRCPEHVGLLIDQPIDSAIHKIWYPTRFAEDKEVDKLLPLNVESLVRRHVDGIGVEPELEMFEHFSTISEHLDLLFLCFFKTPIQCRVEIFRCVAEQRFVQSERLLFGTDHDDYDDIVE